MPYASTSDIFGRGVLAALVLYFLFNVLRLVRRKDSRDVGSARVATTGDRVLKVLVLVARLCLWIALLVSASILTIAIATFSQGIWQTPWYWPAGAFAVTVTVCLLD